jgi:hypothetical protein
MDRIERDEEKRMERDMLGPVSLCLC